MSKRTPAAESHLNKRTQHRLEWIQEHVAMYAVPTETANPNHIRCYFDTCEVDVWLTTGTWKIVGVPGCWKNDWAGFQVKVQEEKLCL